MRLLHRGGVRLRPARPDAPGRAARAVGPLRRPGRGARGARRRRARRVAEPDVRGELERDARRGARRRLSAAALAQRRPAARGARRSPASRSSSTRSATSARRATLADRAIRVLRRLRTRLRGTFVTRTVTRRSGRLPSACDLSSAADAGAGFHRWERRGPRPARARAWSCAPRARRRRVPQARARRPHGPASPPACGSRRRRGRRGGRGRPRRCASCGRYASHPRYGPQIDLRALDAAGARASFALADLLDGPPRSAEQMEADLRELVATVREPHLRRAARRASSARARRRGRATATRPRRSTSTRPTATACSSTR